MKLSLSLFATIVGLASALPLSAAPQNFAGTVVSSSHLSTATYFGSTVEAFNDPTSALGQPTTLQNDTFGDLAHASMVNSAYGVDQTSGKNLLVGFDNSGLGQVTVQMSAPIIHTGTTWYNQDFLVFGNTFFTGPGFADDTTDMSTYKITDGAATGMLPQVSVSADNITFYTVAPSGTLAFPENPYHWDGMSAASPSGWGALNDFSKPVNPALTAADFVGQSVAVADNTLYNGSAGGTAYSFFGQTPLTTIDYVRFSAVPAGSHGIIDGIAAVGSAPVPEAATSWSLLVGLFGLAGLVLRKRAVRA